MYNYDEMPEMAGFHKLEIEKVCRISTMLEKMMDVSFLKERLSLIGGTAINFIYTKPLARLSVDLDFNCHHIDEEDWGICEELDIYKGFRCKMIRSVA